MTDTGKLDEATLKTHNAVREHKYDTSAYVIDDGPMRLVNCEENVVVPREEFDEIKNIIASIKNQTLLSSYARAGDPTQSHDLIIEACWAGSLQKALAILEKHGGGG